MDGLLVGANRVSSWLSVMKHSKGELTYLFTIGHMPESGRKLEITADQKQCALVAHRAGIPNVSGLRAELHCQYLPHSHILQIKGQIFAEFVQLCSLTLEPFDVSEQFEFTSQAIDAAKTNPKANALFAPEDLGDGFDPIINDTIDLGELVVQQFIVNIDPYPRKPAFDGGLSAPLDHATQNSPFSVLNSLKKK